MKKEIMDKLRIAKQEQAKASAAMQASKKALDSDISAEKKAANVAKAALSRATKTGKHKDMGAARADMKKVEADKGKVANDRKRLNKEKKIETADVAKVRKLNRPQS